MILLLAFRIVLCNRFWSDRELIHMYIHALLTHITWLWRTDINVHWLWIVCMYAMYTHTWMGVLLWHCLICAESGCWSQLCPNKSDSQTKRPEQTEQQKSSEWETYCMCYVISGCMGYVQPTHLCVCLFCVLCLCFLKYAPDFNVCLSFIIIINIIILINFFFSK